MKTEEIKKAMAGLDTEVKNQLIDAVINCFNCQEADMDSDGDIWIENPQRGHWLNDDEYESLIEFIENETGQAIEVWLGIK